MTAAGQVAFTFDAPAEEKLALAPRHRDEIGVCDTCQGETNGFTYARQVGARMMLLCESCDKAVL